MSLLTWLLTAGVAALIASLWLILSNWHGFKGTYLIDIASMATTEGKVISSSIYTSKWKRKIHYHYSITYIYTVNGKLYTSDAVAFNDNDSVRQEVAQSYIDKYYVGKEVIVYYDPKEPAFSVLEPDNRGDAVLKVLCLFVSVILFILAGIHWFLKRRRAKQQT